MNNLYKVFTEDSFKTIMKKYSDKVVITLFNKQVNSPLINFLITLSKMYTSCIFIYVNTNTFVDKDFLNMVNVLPSFVFLYKNKRVLNIESEFETVGDSITALIDQINTAKKNIENKKKENKETNIYSEDQKIKLAMLKKLHDLKKQGYDMLGTYTIDSDYEDMLWEYNIHTNPQSIVVESSSFDTNYEIPFVEECQTETTEDLDQEKINKINELLQLREQLCSQKNNQI